MAGEIRSPARLSSRRGKRALHSGMKGALMKIADCGRQRVRGVRRDGFREAEERGNHFLHLLFARLAVADDGKLYLRGGVFVDRDSALSRGQQGDAARLPELERALGVAGEEDSFQARSRRRVSLDHFQKSLVDALQAAGLRQAGR